jgi:hypothetical protein
MRRDKLRHFAFTRAWFEHPFHQLKELISLFRHKLSSSIGSINIISRHGQFNKPDNGPKGFCSDFDESYRLNNYDDKYDIDSLNKRMDRFNEL